MHPSEPLWFETGILRSSQPPSTAPTLLKMYVLEEQGTIWMGELLCIENERPLEIQRAACAELSPVKRRNRGPTNVECLGSVEGDSQHGIPHGGDG